MDLRFLECVGYASTNEGFRLEDPEGAATHAAISCTAFMIECGGRNNLTPLLGGLRALKSLTDNPQKQTKTLTERVLLFLLDSFSGQEQHSIKSLNSHFC